MTEKEKWAQVASTTASTPEEGFRLGFNLAKRYIYEFIDNMRAEEVEDNCSDSKTSTRVTDTLDDLEFLIRQLGRKEVK